MDKKHLQQFLDIHHCFIRGAAGLLFPVTETLKGKSSVLTWNLEMIQSFSAAQTILSKVLSPLMPLDPTLVQFYNKMSPVPGLP